MPCFSPLRAYRGPGGQIHFSRKEGWSDRPLDLQCGQCIGCRIERSRMWAVRCVHEAQLHDRNSFITLTYSPECLPPDGGLHIRHWQLFAKRLRRKIGAFRFFHCGEYGEENLRPHYHACIFGVDFSGDRSLWKKTGDHPLYRSKLLEDAWSMGFCSVGDLSFQSAAYVSRYILKKVTGDLAAKAYERVDPDTGEVFRVKPEYVSMSRRPGLGAGWIEKFKSDVYPADEVVIAGKRYRPPRFYDATLEESELERIKAGRLEKAAQRFSDLVPDRLECRERVLRRKVSSLTRSI